MNSQKVTELDVAEQDKGGKGLECRAKELEFYSLLGEDSSALSGELVPDHMSNLECSLWL